MTAVSGSMFQGQQRNSTGSGVSLVPGNNTYPAPVEVFGSGTTVAWTSSTATDDAYALEVNINSSTVSASSKDLKVNLYYVMTYTDAGGLDATNDTITFTNRHGLATGDVCTFATTGVITVGLNTSSDWFVIVVDENTIALATSEALAKAGTRRNLTAGGSGTQTLTCRKIQHLSGSEAAAPTAQGAGGHTYYFPLWIPAGVLIYGSASVNNATVGTVNVLLNLLTKPTKPWMLRTGTLVRTFGSTPATSAGTAITPVSGSKSAYVDLGAMTDDLWHWNFGVGFDNAAYANNNVQYLDLAVGETGTERLVIRDAYVLPSNTETLSSPVFTRHAMGEAVVNENVFVRMQSVGAPSTGWSVLGYGVGGRYQPPNTFTVAGTVTISGSPAPNGKTVEIYAVDSAGCTELVTTATTAGGAGGFSALVPDNGRTYFASYNNDSNVGRSLSGTPV